MESASVPAGPMAQALSCWLGVRQLASVTLVIANCKMRRCPSPRPVVRVME